MKNVAVVLFMSVIMFLLVSSLTLACTSDSDCQWCGSECVEKRSDLICPLILPPAGYNCSCIYNFTTNSTECKKVPNVQLLIKTDKSSYNPDKTVYITMKNVGEIPVKIPSTNYEYFDIDTDYACMLPDGTVEFGGMKSVSSYCYDYFNKPHYKPEILLNPRESKVFEWDLSKCYNFTFSPEDDKRCREKGGYIVPSYQYTIHLQYKSPNEETLGCEKMLVYESENKSHIMYNCFNYKEATTTFVVNPLINLSVNTASTVCENGVITVWIENSGSQPTNEITLKSGNSFCTIPFIPPKATGKCVLTAYEEGYNQITINTTGWFGQAYVYCPGKLPEKAIPSPAVPPSQSIPAPIDKTVLAEILLKLENLRIKFDSLRAMTQPILDYYQSVDNTAKATCWKEVTMMFEASILKVENIKAEINLIKDNPMQEDVQRIKGMINDLRTNIDKIINKIFECG